MDAKQALQVLQQSSDMAQAKGVFTLKDAVVITQALEVLGSVVEPVEVNEPAEHVHEARQI